MSNINGVNSNSNNYDPYAQTKINGQGGTGKKDPPGQTKPPGPTTPPPVTPPAPPPPTDPVIPPPITPPTDPPAPPPPTEPVTPPLITPPTEPPVTPATDPAPVNPTAAKPVTNKPATFNIYDFKGELAYKPPKVEEKKVEGNTENSALRSAQKKLQAQETDTKSQPANPGNMVQLLSLKIKSFIISLLSNPSAEPKVKPENGQPAPENKPISNQVVAGNDIKNIQSDFNSFVKEQVGRKENTEENNQNINNPAAVNPNTKNTPLSHVDFLA
ncbi:MAG TPA: hypothetical protein VHY08_14660 [Bacillota bacterium]|nr:hypothetical protein [Bacillota bacterium]